MNKLQVVRVFVCALCFSLVLVANGFQVRTAEARENLPIGEMISNGEVKFEVRENWKNVESSHFSVFQGTRIKTEEGVAALTLSNNTLVEVDQRSLFSFDRKDRFVLTQGSIRFRIPSASETTFKAGNVSVVKSQSLQAVIGSISIHANGAVTVKSVQGELTVLNQDQVVVAGLSSAESATIPSVSGKAAPRATLARADQTVGGSNGKEVSKSSSGFVIATQSEGVGPQTGGKYGLLPNIADAIGRSLCR